MKKPISPFEIEICFRVYGKIVFRRCAASDIPPVQAVSSMFEMTANDVRNQLAAGLLTFFEKVPGAQK